MRYDRNEYHLHGLEESQRTIRRAEVIARRKMLAWEFLAVLIVVAITLGTLNSIINS